MRTLTLSEAADLLKVHPKTAEKLARHGHLPACKVGRSWVFVDQLLFDLLVTQSLARVSVVDLQENTECRSTDAKTPPTGGSNYRPSGANRSLYSKALGLPTNAKRSRSTTGSLPPGGSRNGSA
ncbi:helix-turn-helix domain-containing protein [Ideonella alba]|uniref:helix-turn-helix domain-containing protein n=1 Tax=Ideonella alba TaxID=2824118 RepID=UPI00287398BC|nr:helix-turn-helix domain-containing protein [Ideonella alba]